MLWLFEKPASYGTYFGNKFVGFLVLLFENFAKQTSDLFEMEEKTILYLPT